MLPEPILDLAARSSAGLVDNRAILRAGFSSWAITEWVREGELERLLPGQYRVAADPVPPHQRLHATQAYLARRQRNCHSADRSRPQALFTAGSALAVLDALPEGVAAGTPTVLVDHTRRVRLGPDLLAVVRADLQQEGAVRVQRLHLATPARAVADIAEDDEVTDLQLRTTVDALRHRRRLDIVDAVARWRGMATPGAVRLRRLARSGTLEQESEAERDLLRDVLRLIPGLPDAQVWLHPRYRVDFVYLGAGLVIEYHGVAAHRDRVDADAVRVYELHLLGYVVLVVTRSMLRDPEGLAAHIMELRRRREADIREGRVAPPSPPLARPRLSPLRSWRTTDGGLHVPAA